jgi:hypothetical protein
MYLFPSCNAFTNRKSDNMAVGMYALMKVIYLCFNYQQIIRMMDLFLYSMFDIR